MKNFVITYRLESDDLFLRREVNHAGTSARKARESFQAEHPDAQIIEQFEGLLLSKSFIWDSGRGERAEAAIHEKRRTGGHWNDEAGDLAVDEN